MQRFDCANWIGIKILVGCSLVELVVVVECWSHVSVSAVNWIE